MLTFLWIQLALAATIIVVAAMFLTRASDVIAVKTGLGRSFAGVVLLATATSLPELGTGVSSVAIVGEPDLAAGDAFGSNLFNLLIVGLLDLLWWNRNFLGQVSPSAVIIGMLAIGVTVLATLSVQLHSMPTPFDDWFLSPVSVGVIGFFIVAMYVIYNREASGDTVAIEDMQYVDKRLSASFLLYGLAALLVVGAAIWLATVGDFIADEMGWEASFMGTQFLAAATSLPELATSYAAIRINAPELAISNLLGSNIFNMGFVLFLDDVAYTNGAFWAAISPIHVLTGVFAVLMTLILVLYLRSGVGKVSPTFPKVVSPLLVGMYATASFLVWRLG